MIKDLQEKTFKMNLEENNLHERSIIMQKREVVQNAQQKQSMKLLENQMFDADGNVLLTNCSSANQSVILNNMLLQTHGLV